MRCWLIVVVLSLLAPAAPRAQQETSPNGSTPPADSAAVYAALSRVAPSLVRIHVVSIDHEDGRELKREASHHREMHTRPVHHEVMRGTPRTEGSDD